MDKEEVCDEMEWRKECAAQREEKVGRWGVVRASGGKGTEKREEMEEGRGASMGRVTGRGERQEVGQGEGRERGGERGDEREVKEVANIYKLNFSPFRLKFLFPL